MNARQVSGFPVSALSFISKVANRKRASVLEAAAEEIRHQRSLG
jgi:hypothetical protein